MEQEMAEVERVKKAKEERATARMRLKVNHVAAMYIQFIWRRHVAVRKDQQARANRAARAIATFITEWCQRKRAIRRQASLRIQRQWRSFIVRREFLRSFTIVRRFLLSWIRQRRATIQRARVIQRLYHRRWLRRRRLAATRIQRCWRRRTWLLKIDFLATAYAAMQHAALIDHSARVLQRALATNMIYRRLISTPELAEYPSLAAIPWTELRCDGDGVRSKLELENAVAISKQLKLQEAAANAATLKLQHELEKAKAALTDEHERLLRHAAVEEYRRIKDEETSASRLQETEIVMRRQIRMEIERELETARRLVLRSKKSKSGGDDTHSMAPKSIAIVSDSQEEL